MPGLIIFDLDGTLLCTHKHIIKAANKTLSEYNLSILDEQTITSFIGEPSKIFCKNIAPNCRNIGMFINSFRHNERNALRESGVLYNGVAELLSMLKKENFVLAICSNGSKKYIELALSATGLTGKFQYMCSTQEFTSKTEAVHSLVNKSHCENVIMVGDRYNDLDAAQLNHIPFIAAMYGYGTSSEMENACFYANTPGSIFPLVMQITLFTQLYTKIKQIKKVRCIGINGVDTSGKTIFSNQFANVLRSKGLHVEVIHLDDFHNPKALREKGINEIDAYITNAFDLHTLINEILCPLQQQKAIHKTLTLLDLDSDTFTLKRRFTISEETVVILEGVLLYRQPLEDFIDYKIYLDISFDEVIRRATVRDVPKYGREFLNKYYTKYIPIQKWYLTSCNPKEKSNIVIDNSNPEYPHILS